VVKGFDLGHSKPRPSNPKAVPLDHGEFRGCASGRRRRSAEHFAGSGKGRRLAQASRSFIGNFGGRT